MEGIVKKKKERIKKTARKVKDVCQAGQNIDELIFLVLFVFIMAQGIKQRSKVWKSFNEWFNHNNKIFLIIVVNLTVLNFQPGVQGQLVYLFIYKAP